MLTTEVRAVLQKLARIEISMNGKGQAYAPVPVVSPGSAGTGPGWVCVLVIASARHAMRETLFLG